MTAFVVLIVGVLFLLQDLNVWNFWGISGWTAVFVLVGIFGLGASCCKACRGCCEGSCESTDMPAKKGKK